MDRHSGTAIYWVLTDFMRQSVFEPNIKKGGQFSKRLESASPVRELRLLAEVTALKLTKVCRVSILN
jgi:hypothetical protein